MKPFAFIQTVVSTVILTLATGAALAAPKKGGPDIPYLLGKVPASDPAATEVIEILPKRQGQYPRLIFTEDEYATLKSQIPGDPILQESYDRVSKAASGFRIPKGPKPSFVKGDTAALSKAGGSFPNLALAYGIDRDPQVKEKLIGLLELYLNEPHWATGRELDSNMGAGNNMLAVGLAFDAVADELEPAFRQQVAEKLLTHVRRLHYLGFEKGNDKVLHYWQQDPANNHRWHRIAGMSACLLSIADMEELETDYLMEQLKGHMDFVMEWYPEDGDCHEGTGYQTFGFHFLAIAAMMLDNNIGTNYLEHPGFRNAWMQQVYSTVPGGTKTMSFGDANNKERGLGHYGAAFFLSPKLTRNQDVQAAMAERYRFQTKDNRSMTPYTYPWMMLVYYDATVGEGDINNLPTEYLMADMGVAYLRDSWEEDAVLMMFKCGPYGGYKLNEYRNTNDFHYVNVAHDDPDANTFSIAMDNELVVHPGTYFSRKWTANHNTILVNGKGQIGEGSQYTQPVPETDMTTLSYLTSWKKGDDGRIIVEGEAGNAYPDLKQFRRTAIWLPQDYILILDHVAAEGEQEINWVAYADNAQFDDPAAGKGHLKTQDGDPLKYQIFSNRQLEASIDYYQFYGRFFHLLMNRTQFDATAESVRYATIFDPWKRGDLELTFDDQDGKVTLTVKGKGIDDTWSWTPSSDLQTPSTITGKRNGQPLIALTPADKAPHGHAAHGTVAQTH